MAILSGALTVRRFRVVGEVPESYRDLYRDRLGEFAFHERPVEATNKEEHQGWVLVHNLLDTDFSDFNRWLYNQYAVFALRVDKKSLPANLFRATLEKRCQAWCREHEVERCPTAMKKQLKEELEIEWLKRAFPRVSVTEACWNITDGYVVLHALSASASDRFRKLFHRTFGLKLVPWSPLDWVGDSASSSTLEALLEASPSALYAEVQ